MKNTRKTSLLGHVKRRQFVLAVARCAPSFFHREQRGSPFRGEQIRYEFVPFTAVLGVQCFIHPQGARPLRLLPVQRHQDVPGVLVGGRQLRLFGGGVGHGVAGGVNGVMSLAAPRRRRLPDFL